MVPLSQPTVTRNADGKLVCAFTTYLYGNTQVVQNGDVVNAGEIFISVSANNGSTWSTPTNVTNTPNIEEKHPSLAPATSDSLRLYYVRDLKAGSWVTVADWGKAPVYGIFKKGALPNVGIKENVSIAKNYELFQNYPNPFNPSTTINFAIPTTGLVTLKIYDVVGKEVATLVNEVRNAGNHSIKYNASGLSSGVYFYRLQTGDFVDTKKMFLLK